MIFTNTWKGVSEIYFTCKSTTMNKGGTGVEIDRNVHNGKWAQAGNCFPTQSADSRTSCPGMELPSGSLPMGSGDHCQKSPKWAPVFTTRKPFEKGHGALIKGIFRGTNQHDAI